MIIPYEFRCSKCSKDQFVRNPDNMILICLNCNNVHTHEEKQNHLLNWYKQVDAVIQGEQ
jgi:hypothetical protein